MFLLSAVSLIVAITIHEFSHALVADRLGDPTARSMGRLTLNPLAHLDPLGTIMLLLANFGWGKPVPFDPYNLASPRRDSALISLAGPTSNMLLAIILSFVSHLLVNSPFAILFAPLIIVNVSLAIFNLVPIAPLDGAKIITGILPRDLAYEWDQIVSRYGTVLLLLMIFPFAGSSLVSSLISPIINFILTILL